MTPRAAFALLLLGLAGTALLLTRRSQPRADAPAFPVVRDAGTSEMVFKPLGWDLQDETVDESFPASDPPGNY